MKGSKIMKKLIALMTVLAMTLTMILPMGITVSASTAWANIFAADFDTTVPTFTTMQGGTNMPAETIVTGDDNHVKIDDTGGWRFAGYVFDEAMNGGNYKISFDFMLTSVTAYGGVYLTDEAHGGNNQYKEFALLDIVDTSLAVNSVAVSGLTFSNTSWYSYEMSLNHATGAYTVTVTDKADASNTGTLSGTISTSKNYNVIMFGTNVIVEMDDIYVKKEVTAPTVKAVNFYDAEGSEVGGLGFNTAKVGIEFSDKMNETTLDGAVTFGGSTVDGALATDGMTYVFDIDETVAGQTYAVAVSTAATSNYAVALASAFSASYKAYDDIVLFQADFDTPYPSFTKMPDWSGSVEAVEDSTNGDKNIKIYDHSGWTYGGWLFSDAMNGGEYEITFDFKGTVASGRYGQVFLVDSSAVGSQPSNFMLLDNVSGVLEIGHTSRSGGVALSDLTFSADSWYSYKMTINHAAGTFEATVTDKADAANTDTVTGAISNEKAFNAIMFGTKVLIEMDDILVKQIVNAPEVKTVKFLDADGAQVGGLDMSAAAVAIEFTEVMDATTLDGVVTFGGSAVDGTLSDDGKTYTFALNGINYGNQYALAITTAAKSIYGVALTEAFSAQLDAYQGIYLMNADFDTTVPEFVQFETNHKAQGRTPSMTIEGTDDKYAKLWNGRWDGAGFELTQALNSGIWEISFDFKNMTEYSSYGGLRLTTSTSYPEDALQNEFKLLVPSGGVWYTGSSTYTITPDATKWYTFKMSLNGDAKTYTATVTEKGNATNTSTLEGTISDKAYDRIAFGYGKGDGTVREIEMSIDNLKVARPIDAPVVSAIKGVDYDDTEQTTLTASTKAVEVVFSEEMNESSLSGSIKFTNAAGSAVNFTGALAEDGKTYVMTLADDELLTAGAEYTINVLPMAMSVHNLEAEAYSKTLTVDDGKTLLRVDYDDYVRDIEKYDGLGTSTPMVDGDNDYLSYSWSWINSGYSFSEPIPKNGGNYKLTFDFKDFTASGGKYPVAIAQKDLLSGATVYNQFGILGMDGGKLLMGGSTFDTLTYTADKWYSYSLEFNRTSRAFTVTITQKDDATNTQTLTGSLPDENYSAGMLENRVYDALKFMYVGTISIDNILMTKTAGTPSLSNDKLSFADADGNTVTDRTKVKLNTKTITLDFGEAINPRTIADKVTLSDVEYEVSVDGSKLVLTLGAELEPTKTYTLAVAEGISAMTGGSAAAFETTFTTVARELKAELTGVYTTAETPVKVEEFATLVDGTYNVKMTALNSTGTDASVDVIIAYYRANGSLAKVKINPVTIANGTDGEVTAEITIEKTTDTAAVNVMCWHSVENVKPLSTMLDF